MDIIKIEVSSIEKAVLALAYHRDRNKPLSPVSRIYDSAQDVLSIAYDGNLKLVPVSVDFLEKLYLAVRPDELGRAELEKALAAYYSQPEPKFERRNGRIV